MKKIITAITMAAIVAIMAVGCGKGDGTDENVYPDMDGIKIVSGDTDYSECAELGNYEGLKLTKQSYSYTQEKVKQYADEWKDYNILSDPNVVVQEGDYCSIDYTGTINGEEFDGGNATDYQLVVGSGTMIDGFEDALLGMRAGEEKDVSLTFPESYNTYGGQTANFHIVINNIARKDPITEEDLKDAEDAIVKSYEDQNISEMKSDAWSQIVGSSTFKEIPADLLDFYEDHYDEATAKYYDSVEGYMDEFDMTEEEYNEAKKSYAVENAKYTILVELLCQKFGITEDSDAYKKVLEDYLDTHNMTEEEAYEEYGEEFLKFSMKFNAVMDEVLSMADITEAPADESSAFESSGAPEETVTETVTETAQ